MSLLIPAAIALVAVLAVFSFAASYMNTQVYSNCTVTDKDRGFANKDRSNMRVYTTCGTFEAEDLIFAGQFNSADIYGSMTTGDTFDITASGFRIPILSMFPIIHEAEKK